MAVSISISITQNSQNITNNTSNVTAKVTAKWTGGSWNATGQCTGSLTIDGTKYSFSGIKFNTNRTTSGSQVIMTKTVNVSHSSDGSKTLACSASFVTGVSSGTVTASASKTLTTIPRKSTLSANNGTLGTEQTLAVSRKSTSFTHTITYKCGSATGTVCTKSSDLTPKWTPPLSLAQQNKTGTSVSVTFTITTYNGNTSIGSNTETITCSIPASVKPTVSLAVSDSLGYANTYGGYVQGLSKFEIAVTASGSYGSTIKTYKTTANGKTYTTANITTGVISGSGTKTISVTVTDSRGRTASASVDVTVLAYASPKISALSCYRSDANGKASSSGAYLAVKFSASITSLDSKNTATYFVEYRKTTDSDYTKKTLTNYANKYSVSNGIYVFSADAESSYNIILTAKDAFKSVPRITSGSSVKKLVSLLKKGGAIVGIAINKIAEIEDVFDVNFKALFRKNIYVPALSTIQVENTDGTYRNVFDPCNVENHTLVGYGNYSAKDRITKLCGHDIEFLVSNLPQSQNFRPYRRQGDIFSLTLRTSGYVTNAGTEVHFTIPMSEAIIGSPTVTLASGTGFILRQGANYTHGSGAEKYIKAKTFQATATYLNGIRVVATFSDKTNVINNDAIGIYWNGTITLS